MQAGDKSQQALFYSGVPSVEFAITEYLEKYALPAKVSNGVHGFQDKLSKLGLEAKAFTELREKGEAEVEKLEEELASIARKLSQGEKGKEIRRKIERISASKEVQDKFEQERAPLWGR